MKFPSGILHFLKFIIMIQFAFSFIEVQLPHHSPLLGQSFHQTNLPTFYQCMELCVAYKLCRSLYHSKRGTCALNSDDYDRQLLWITGYDYKTIRKEEIPQEIGGAFSGHTCAINEMCVQAGLQYLCVEHEYSTVRCPESWGHKDDLCFMVSILNKTWTDAEDYCASTGAELLMIESDTEYQYHLFWMNIMLQIHTWNAVQSGKIWIRLPDSPVLPSWVSTTLTATNGSNLCMGLIYNRTLKSESEDLLRGGLWEAASCDEKNGFACQHRAPDYWP